MKVEETRQTKKKEKKSRAAQPTKRGGGGNRIVFQPLRGCRGGAKGGQDHIWSPGGAMLGAKQGGWN